MEDAYVLTLKNRKFSEFYLCYCGYAKCEPLHSFGPAVRPNYLIHLILEGKGRYQIGDTQYELTAGQGFLIEPEVQTFYQADKDDPWTYLWVGFNGSRSQEYLADIGLGSNHKIFQCEDTSGLRQLLVEILKKNTYTVENDFYREGFLYTFFGLLSGNIKGENISRHETENLYVRKALEYIQNNYHYGIRVSDIADYVGVTRGYLHTLLTSPRRNISSITVSPGRSSSLRSRTWLWKASPSPAGILTRSCSQNCSRRRQGKHLPPIGENVHNDWFFLHFPLFIAGNIHIIRFSNK